MLPQLIQHDTYADTYRMHCEDSSTYVILDNGAAEGYTPEPGELLGIAEDFGVDEIVLPDILGDAEETLRRSREYLDELHEYGANEMNYMFVCQGQDMFEFVDSAETASRWHEVTTIGIPRHALQTCSNDLARSSIANILQGGAKFNKQIHFLGASSRFAREATILSNDAQTKQNLVRGMDTSMPFNYAFKGVRMQDGVAIDRVDDYFDLKERDFVREILLDQVSVFEVWARNPKRAGV